MIKEGILTKFLDHIIQDTVESSFKSEQLDVETATSLANDYLLQLMTDTAASELLDM